MILSHGYAPSGKRLHAKAKSRADKRFNILASLRNNQIFAPLIFGGTCDSVSFEYYVEKILCPELIAGNVVIMDNYSIHKTLRVKQLIEAKGCRLLFLPTYSPDFNPIERHWFPIKNNIKKALNNNPDREFLDVVKDVFQNVKTLS